MSRPMLSTELRAVGATYLTPHMRRITFEGPGLADFVSVAPDQQVKLFFARNGGALAVPAPAADGDVTRWYRDYLAIPESERPWMRSYTVRHHLADRRQIVIDFVLHGAEGDMGPASRWAATARTGDVIWMYGPASSRKQVREQAAWRLFVGDETALPAIGAFLEQLAPGERAFVCAEVSDATEEQRWRSAGDVDVRWVHGGGGPRTNDPALVRAVRATRLPGGEGFAWVAGEASLVRAVRRHLVDECGMDRRAVAFTGYWRRHLSQDDAFTEEDIKDRTDALE
ncbi:siderophore-interacting protein [Streptomyces sp. Agncl-13]|uniref:siderophore-interacting protein n=1 Tax=Streptomyces sp. Agncl-13 TaxID=3400628 RepID=UPI003A8B7004